MLTAAVALSTAAFAQGEKTTVRDSTTGAKTTITTRDNGTTKVEARTGRTEAGQKAYNTKEDVKDAGKKTGSAVGRGARKTGTVVKKGARKTGHAVKKGAKAVKNKTEDVVD
ncbi:hypothetical protein GCM10027346_25970 [Hymenobacter seoulensis]